MASRIDFAPGPVLKTPRLKLRPWRESDLALFAAMNADRDVMRYFPAPLTGEESDALVESIQARFRKWGFGFWAVESAGADFMGFIGLSRPGFEAHFTPAVEIGWRLAPAYWGKGYAIEGASAALQFGFGEGADVCDADEVVAFAPQKNAPSIAVMKRLGMTHDPRDDFDHPALSEESGLRRCVLYRINRVAWRDRQAIKAN